MKAFRFMTKVDAKLSMFDLFIEVLFFCFSPFMHHTIDIRYPHRLRSHLVPRLLLLLLRQRAKSNVPKLIFSLKTLFHLILYAIVLNRKKKVFFFFISSYLFSL